MTRNHDATAGSPMSDPGALLGRCVQTLDRMRAMGLSPVITPATTTNDPPTLTTQSALPDALAHIRDDLGDCQRCDLCHRRKHIVFGQGSPTARVVFVGEGPGEEEDRQGVPFVGAAGDLLTRIIAAMGLSREEVYICNVIKCRPPGNRNPTPDEIATCFPFLERQLSAIQPACVCALGAVAAHALSGSSQPISAMRGTFFQAFGTRVMPTFHPAYLLRNPARKRDVWEDMKLIMTAMGLEAAPTR